MQLRRNKPGAAQCSPLCLLSCCRGQHQRSSSSRQLLNQDPTKNKTDFTRVLVTLESINLKTLWKCKPSRRKEKERESGNLFLLGGRKLLGDSAPPVNNLLPLAAGESSCPDEPLCSSPTVSLFAVSFRFLFCIQHI